MQYSSFTSGSPYLSGVRGRIRGTSIQAGNVYYGGAGYGIPVYSGVQQPMWYGASRGVMERSVSSGGGFSSGFGAGFGAGSAAGFGGGLKSGGAYDVGAGAVGMMGNEKFTMRLLNERLASYLKKVQMLEKANAELEMKIRQFVESRISPSAQDHTDSMITITDLQKNINDSMRLKGEVFILLDNATLAADDFRVKYENEVALRQVVEADIAELKRLLEDLKLQKSELLMQIDTLNGDKAYITKVFNEEMVTTRTQMGGQIHVEVDSAPQQDLLGVLDDIREHYEAIAAKNRRELETWFKAKLDTLKQEVVSTTQTAETSKTELSTEKTKVQGLDLELQSILAVKTTLEGTLAEVKAFYSVQLSGHQMHVMSLEEQLLHLRSDLERQSRDYQMLLDIKTRLEMEIAEYRRLMDLGAAETSPPPADGQSATDPSRFPVKTR